MSSKGPEGEEEEGETGSGLSMTCIIGPLRSGLIDSQNPLSTQECEGDLEEMLRYQEMKCGLVRNLQALIQSPLKVPLRGLRVVLSACQWALSLWGFFIAHSGTKLLYFRKVSENHFLSSLPWL